LIESRKHDTLRLQQDNGETWNALVHPDYQGEGAYLSYWTVTTSPTGVEHAWEVRYVPVSAPVSVWEGGFTLFDDTVGDSQWFPSATTPPDFAQWYPPATATLGLRVSATRWNNQLSILHPTGASTLLVRGNLQGSWGVTLDAEAYFTSYGWFDASALVPPGAPWVLWDATRNEFLVADEGATTDFINSTDNTGSDGDGLPDWYEFMIGSDPNNADSDGDGYSDGWEVARSYNPLDADDPPATLDSDGDGIPDRWEMQHGLNPFDPDDATADSDGDGYSNLQESQAGTDIHSNASAPASPLSGQVFSFGNAPLSIQLSIDGADPAAVTYEIVSGPTLGTLSGDGPNLTYQRTAAGEDSLQFVIHQGAYTSPASTILIHNDPPFVVDVPVEVAGVGLTLQGFSEGSVVDVPLVSLGPDGAGNVRMGVDLTGLDAGVPLSLYDPSSGGNYYFTPWPGGSLGLAGAAYGPYIDGVPVPYYGPARFSFAVDEARSGHVLGLVIPETGSIFPLTQTGIAGWNSYDVDGVAFWTGLGFFNAYAQTGLTAAGNFLVVDMTTGEQSPANMTNLAGQAWEPLSVGLITRAVTIVVPAVDFSHFPEAENSPLNRYTLHTSTGFSGSLQSLVPTGGAAPWTVNGQVGLGETYWLTRDSDGASSEQRVLDWETASAGNVTVDWSGAFPPARWLTTQSFQIGSGRAGHAIAVVHPDGFRTYLAPDPAMAGTSSDLVTWDDDGLEVRYPYGHFLGEADALQGSWWLEDETTGEDLGQVNQVFTGFIPWHPAPPIGWGSVNLIESRKHHALRLEHDNGETWHVTVHPDYQADGAYLSYWAATVSPTGQQQSVEVRYVPASTPISASDGGFTVFDDTAGDSQWFSSWLWSETNLDLAQWYPPATATLGLKVSASRWNNELAILYPSGASTLVTRGNLQGSWGVTLDAMSHFTSYGWFDATVPVHPGAAWVLWDATRNEFLTPDMGATTDFINATDSTDTDGDGLPDWYEFMIGTDLNNPDSDGDGYSDGAEAAKDCNPLDANESPATLDSDGDGIRDLWETEHGLNPLDASDADADWDEDGLTNLQESENGTDPSNADSDGDGLSDLWEVANGLNPSDAGDAGADWDCDGLPNLQEYQNGTDPYKADTDGDGIADAWEVARGMDPLMTDDASYDWDADGLSNYREYTLGTNIVGQDSDGDGFRDGWEFFHGMNPLIWTAPDVDQDNDGLSTLEEYETGTDPRMSDTDGDGIPDGWELAHGLNPNDASDAGRASDTMPPTAAGGSIAGWTNLKVYQMDHVASYVFLLPLSRANDVVTLHCWYEGSGMESTIPATSKSLVPAGWIAANGSYTMAGGMHVAVTFDVNLVQASSWWLSDETMGGRSQAKTFDLRTTPWTSSARCFSIPATRSGHALSVVLENGNSYPVTEAPELSGYAPTAAGGEAFTSLGFFTAWADIENSAQNAGQPFRLVDLTTGEQAPVNTTELVRAAWEPASLPGVQTVWFQIGGDRADHSFSVRPMNGGPIPLYQPWWTTPGANYLRTLDSAAQPIDLHYENFEAAFDVTQSWSLFDETTGEDLGQTTVVSEGWQVWHPEPPAGMASITMSSSRRGHDLWLRQDNGIMFLLNPASGYESPASDLTASISMSFNGTAERQQQDIHYFPAEAQYDPAMGFAILDLTTGEEIHFPVGTPSVDLSQWYPAASPLVVSVSVTRWAHELWLRQSDGYQARLTIPNPGGVLFTPDGLFDAATSYHPGAAWWIYDATTGEISSANPADLITWTNDADGDRDGLPDWHELILGTNPRNPDTDGDGMLDGWEVFEIMNPLVWNAPTADQNNNGRTNRRDYHERASNRDASTNGRLIPNAWAVAYGLNPLDPNLADGDPTGGGMSNYWKYMLGLDPNQVDSDSDGVPDVDEDADGDGIPNGWEIENELDPLNPRDADEDWDGDGLSNSWEYRLGLDPWNPETYAMPDGEADRDADGITDKHEIAGGMNPFDGGDAELDTDEDGFTNLQEYLAGTDPNSASSKPPLPVSRTETTDGYNPVTIEELATGGDPGKTTFEIVPNPNGSVQNGIADFEYLIGDTPKMIYQPPRTMERIDDVSYVAKQGRYTSSPGTIRMINGGVVSVTASRPGTAPAWPFRSGMLDYRTMDRLNANERIVSQGLGLLMPNNDNDDHPEITDGPPPRDNADETVGAPDDDLVMVQLTFNPDDLLQFRKLTLHLPPNVRGFWSPSGEETTTEDLIPFYGDISLDLDEPDENSPLYRLSEAGSFGVGPRTTWIYVEGMEKFSGSVSSGYRLNPNNGDLSLRAETAEPGQPSTTAKITFMQVDLVVVDSEGNPTDIPASPTRSLPSPVIEAQAPVISNLTTNESGDLFATVTVAGKISSDLCDTLPGADGSINTATLYVNDSDEGIDFPVLVNKHPGTTFGKPFPYIGTFSATLQNVRITPGKNTLRLEAKDRIYNCSGYSFWEAEIGGGPADADDEIPAPLPETITFVSPNVTLPDLSLSAVAPNQIQFSLTAASPISTLTETGVQTGLFVSPDGGLIVELGGADRLRSDRRNPLAVTITAPAFGIDHAVLRLAQSTHGSLEFTGSGMVVAVGGGGGGGTGGPGSPVRPYYVARTSFVEESIGGEFHPFAVRMRAPASVSGMFGITMGDQRFGGNSVFSSMFVTFPGAPGALYLKRDDANAPAIFTMRPRFKNPDEVNGQSNIQFLQGYLLGPRAASFWEFQKGFVAGMGGGGWEMITGLGKVALGGLKYVGRSVVIFSCEAHVLMNGKDSDTATSVGMELASQQQAVHDDIGKVLAPLVALARANSESQAKVIVALLTGDRDMLVGATHDLSELHLKIFQFGAELIAEEMRAIGEESNPRQQGYLMGRAVFEVASILVPMADAGQLAKLTKLEFLKEIQAKSKFFKPGGPGAAAFAKLNEETGLIKRLERMDEGPWCFVAGTPVWTAHGWQAIDSIQVGDGVLARDPETGREQLRRVLATHVTHPAGLVHVRYAALGRNGGEEDEVVCTREHPFGLAGLVPAKFVPAGELRPGDRLSLAQGREAVVTAVRDEAAPAGGRFTTYNLTVEADHTFFVGRAGVWVHNTCRAAQTVEDGVVAAEKKAGQTGDLAARKRPYNLEETLEKKQYRPVEDANAAMLNVSLSNSKVMLEDITRMLNAAEGDLVKQTQILADMPTYRYWDRVMDKFGVKRFGVADIHHSPPKALLKTLKEDNGLLLGLHKDDLPAHVMEKAAHKAMSDEMGFLNEIAFKAKTPAEKVQSVIFWYEEYSELQGATSEIGKACLNLADLLRAQGLRI
jgi:hypothetical protein